MDNLRRRTLIYLEEEDIPSTAQVATSGNTVTGNVLYYPLYDEIDALSTTDRFLLMYGAPSYGYLDSTFNKLYKDGNSVNILIPKYVTTLPSYGYIKLTDRYMYYKTPQDDSDVYIPVGQSIVSIDKHKHEWVMKIHGYIKLKFTDPVCICEFAKNSSGSYTMKKPGTILPGLEHPFYLDNE